MKRNGYFLLGNAVLGVLLALYSGERAFVAIMRGDIPGAATLMAIVSLGFVILAALAFAVGIAFVRRAANAVSILGQGFAIAAADGRSVQVDNIKRAKLISAERMNGTAGAYVLFVAQTLGLSGRSLFS